MKCWNYVRLTEILRFQDGVNENMEKNTHCCIHNLVTKYLLYIEIPFVTEKRPYSIFIMDYFLLNNRYVCFMDMYTASILLPDFHKYFNFTEIEVIGRNDKADNKIFANILFIAIYSGHKWLLFLFPEACHFKFVLNRHDGLRLYFFLQRGRVDLSLIR